MSDLTKTTTTTSKISLPRFKLIDGLVQHRGLCIVASPAFLSAEGDAAIGEAKRGEAVGEESGQEEAGADDDGHDGNEVEGVEGSVT